MYVHIFVYGIQIRAMLSSGIITSLESGMLCNHSYAASSGRIRCIKQRSLHKSKLQGQPAGTACCQLSSAPATVEINRNSFA